MLSHPLILAAGSVLDASPDVVLEAGQRAGFDGIGLRCSAEQYVIEPEFFRRRSDRYGVPVHDVEVHRIGSQGSNLEMLLGQASAIGATNLLMVSDLADLSRTVDELAVAASMCQEAGVRPALEYMAWTTPSTPDGAVEVARATGCVIVVDLLHHCRVGAGPRELKAVVEADVLGWVQICDGPVFSPVDLVHEARHARLMPGDGALPLGELMAEVPSGVPVSVEVQNDELARNLEPIARAKLLHDRVTHLLNDRK